jgi:16S rRNA (cytosine1402-N4)-methyltransferase
MDRSKGETAADLLARLELNELTRLIQMYGEDSQARRIAKAIIRERTHQSIQSTEDLARVIDRAVPATRNKSLARVFQALRIVVNDELGELEAGLAGAWNLLKPGGRLVVISYHSLEDRIVKNFMKNLAQPQHNQIGFPFAQPLPPLAALLLRKPMVPDQKEIDKNVRARSAKLRAMEKINQLELD